MATGSVSTGQSLPSAAGVYGVSLNRSGAVPPRCEMAVDDSGRLCVDAAAPVRLSDVQAQKLQSILEAPTTWGGAEAKCRLPLHGFIWVGSDQAVTRHVAISMLCDRVEGAPDVPGQPTELQTRGLSGAGLVALRGLCEEVGLPHCQITSPDQAFRP